MRTWLFAVLLGVPGVQAPVTPQQTNDGVIEVTVRDSVSKAPVPGARVRFVAYRTPPPNVLTDTTADENGRAVFKDLALGNYSVSADQEGYVRDLLTALAQAPLTLTEAKRKLEVEVLLVRGGIVRGRVLGPDGNPLAKADVSLRAFTWVQGRRGVAPVAVGQSAGPTDDRGEYAINNLPTGEYLLRVELRPQPTGGQSYSSSFDNLSRVTYYPGVPDALIAPKIPVKAGQEHGGLDIKIPNLKAYRITGTVLNTLPVAPVLNGRPTARGPSSFYIGSPEPDALEDPVLVPSRSEPTANPDEFTFEIGGIIPGSYYLYPLYGGTGPNLDFISTRTLVTVKDHDIENQLLTVEPNPEIKGRVTVRGDTSSFNWQNARLGIRPVDRLPILLARPGLASNVVNSSTGEFVLSAFEKGVKFTVSLSGFPPDSYIDDLRQGGRSLNSDGIIISDPGEGTVEVTIEQQGGRVEGTVSKPTGTPQERAVVALVPAPFMRGNTMRYYRVLGDAAGKFTIRGIAPGEYKAFAWDGIPGTVASQNAEFLAPIESKGIPVTIRAGSSQTVQLTALPNP